MRCRQLSYDIHYVYILLVYRKAYVNKKLIRKTCTYLLNVIKAKLRVCARFAISYTKKQHFTTNLEIYIYYYVI